jgi:methyl-accepting chemotaxis protein
MRKAALVWISLLALGACGEQQKVEECNALVGVINEGIDKVQKITAASPDGGTAVNDLRALADEMDAIAKQAEAAPLTISELQKLSGDYRAMAAEVAAAARELATAVDNVDGEKMKKAQERIVTTVQKEDSLVESINRFCQTP